MATQKLTPDSITIKEEKTWDGEGLSGGPPTRCGRLWQYKTARKRSVVWKVFQKLKWHEKPGVSLSKCGLCGETCRNTGGSTTCMRSHLFRKHSKVMEFLMDAEKGKYFILQDYATTEQLPVTIADIKTEASEWDPNKNERQKRIIVPPHIFNDGYEQMDVSEGYGHGQIVSNALSSAIVNTAITMTCSPIGLSAQAYAINQKVQENQLHQAGQAYPLNQGVQENQLHPAGQAYPLNQGVQENQLHPDVQANLAKFKSIAVMLVRNGLPVKLLGSPEFRAMMVLFDGGIPVPREEVFQGIVVKYIDDMYNLEKKEIREALKGKYICLTVECFKRPGEDYYALFTATYLSDDWTRQTNFLGAKRLLHVTENSSDENFTEPFRRAMFTLIDDYHIKRKHIKSVVLHTDAVVDIDWFSKREKPVMFPCFQEVIRMACDVITSSKRYDDLCDLITKIYDEVFPSVKRPSFPQILKQFVSQRHIFEKYITTSQYDWSKIEELNDYLEPLTSLVECLLEQPDLLPLSLVNFFLKRVLVLMKTNPLFFTPPCYAEIWALLNKAYGVNFEGGWDEGWFKSYAHALSSFFDPRNKLDAFSESIGARVKEFIKERMSKLNLAPQQASKLSAFFFESFDQAYETGSSLTLSCEEELNQYIQSPHALIDTDPYVWWQTNAKTFPRLSFLCKEFFCVQGTAVTASTMFGDSEEFHCKFQKVEAEYLDRFMVLYTAFPGKHFDINMPPILTPANLVPMKQEPLGHVEGDSLCS